MGKPGKPLAIGSTVLGVADVARARDFWTAALGYVPRDAEPDDTWTVLVPPDGADWAGYTDDSDFVVLEDPDGNRFCVVDKSG